MSTILPFIVKHILLITTHVLNLNRSINVDTQEIIPEAKPSWDTKSIKKLGTIKKT